MRVWFLLIFALLIVGCSSKQTREYKLKHDVDPGGQFDVSGVPPVQPKWEPLSRQGNASSYVVRGQRYSVLGSDAEYNEQGVSSWYGLKFHGELTSNGEVYDMYSFSAAHKTLPLPSYVRVTNLDNQEAMVVRVNDRGPFHSDRIIDLSYAAAIKLGFKDKGTARVKVERLILPQPKSFSEKRLGMPSSPSSSVVGGLPAASNGGLRPAPDRLAPFVQVAAYSNSSNAEAMRKKAADVVGALPVFVGETLKAGASVYRVRVGPLKSLEEAEYALKALRKHDVGRPQVITRSVRAPNS